MPPKEVTPGRLVVQAVRATLTLANKSLGVLTTPDLLSMQRDLHRSLAIASKKIDEHEAVFKAGRLFLDVRLC